MKIQENTLISKNMMTVPGDHLLLFIGGTTTTAQVLTRCRQEVQTVIFKCLISQGKQHLGRRNKHFN